MNKKILERVINETNYILKTNKTIREVAKKFNVSKSTVHKDISERLIIISPVKAKKIQKIFNNHILTRHIRGGISTKEKYQNI